MASTLTDPPTLQQKHSGIPERLLDKARAAKARAFENLTIDISSPRKSLPVLPKGVKQASFDKAIAELGEALGKENVVINDKPLVDGW